LAVLAELLQEGLLAQILFFQLLPQLAAAMARPVALLVVLVVLAVGAVQTQVLLAVLGHLDRELTVVRRLWGLSNTAAVAVVVQVAVAVRAL